MTPACLLRIDFKYVEIVFEVECTCDPILCSEVCKKLIGQESSQCRILVMNTRKEDNENNLLIQDLYIHTKYYNIIENVIPALNHKLLYV